MAPMSAGVKSTKIPDLNGLSIVFKLGSRQVIDDDGCLRMDLLRSVCHDLATHINAGGRASVVTSGGIAAARDLFGQPARLRLDDRQAAAAVGHPKVFAAWREALVEVDLVAAQVLLTIDDTETRRRHLNARDTLQQLQKRQVVPVINENDTVATAEIRFGDNDRLAARIAVMIEAELLIILTDVDGFYRSRLSAATESYEDLIPVIERIDEHHWQGASGPSDSFGSGGMTTKLMAAQICQPAGCGMVIMRGKTESEDGPLTRLRQGSVHTFFPPAIRALKARKAWISGHQTLRGVVVIDAGAQQAIRAQRSLLPSGVLRVNGDFDRGDPILITSDQGEKLATGLATYNSREVRKIIGCNSRQIEQRLGYRRRPTVVHADDLVLMDSATLGS